MVVTNNDLASPKKIGVFGISFNTTMLHDIINPMIENSDQVGFYVYSLDRQFVDTGIGADPAI